MFDTWASVPITSVVLIDGSSSWFVTINPNLLTFYLYGPLPTVTTEGMVNVNTPSATASFVFFASLKTRSR